MRLYLLVLLLVAMVAAAPRLNNIKHQSSTPSHRYQHHLGKRDVADVLAEIPTSSSEEDEEEEDEYEDEWNKDREEDEDEDDVKNDLKEAEDEDDEKKEDEDNEDEDEDRVTGAPRRGFRKYGGRL